MQGALAGEVALVTGARGRLGPIWCEALAQAGAEVVGIDVEDADVTDRAALQAVRDGLERPPTVLVNNAGIDQPPDADPREVDFERVLAVNLGGVYNATVVFGEPLTAGGRGGVVNRAPCVGGSRCRRRAAGRSSTSARCTRR